MLVHARVPKSRSWGYSLGDSKCSCALKSHLESTLFATLCEDNLWEFWYHNGHRRILRKNPTLHTVKGREFVLESIGVTLQMIRHARACSCASLARGVTLQMTRHARVPKSRSWGYSLGDSKCSCALKSHLESTLFATLCEDNLWEFWYHNGHRRILRKNPTLHTVKGGTLSWVHRGYSSSDSKCLCALVCPSPARGLLFRWLKTLVCAQVPLVGLLFRQLETLDKVQAPSGLLFSCL
jgi:hypothetical protein